MSCFCAKKVCSGDFGHMDRGRLCGVCPCTMDSLAWILWLGWCGLEWVGLNELAERYGLNRRWSVKVDCEDGLKAICVGIALFGWIVLLEVVCRPNSCK